MAPTIPKLRTEVMPMRGRVVSGKPRLLEEIWTTQRRRMKKTVKTIKIWARSVLDAEFSTVSRIFVVFFCTWFAFAWRDRRPSSGEPVDGWKSSSLKGFGFVIASV